MNEAFCIYVNHSCSMHVYAKPANGWGCQDVQSLAKATAVFNDAITKIMPEDRKRNNWARSNFHAITDHTGKYNAKSLSGVEAALVDDYNRVFKDMWKPLFDCFDSKLGKPEDILDVFGTDRHVSMNFIPINNRICRTVEFRCPPAVSTASDAQKWTAFTLAFVSRSLSFKSWTPNTA